MAPMAENEATSLRDVTRTSQTHRHSRSLTDPCVLSLLEEVSRMEKQQDITTRTQTVPERRPRDPFSVRFTKSEEVRDPYVEQGSLRRCCSVPAFSACHLEKSPSNAGTEAVTEDKAMLSEETREEPSIRNSEDSYWNMSRDETSRPATVPESAPEPSSKDAGAVDNAWAIVQARRLSSQNSTIPCIQTLIVDEDWDAVLLLLEEQPEVARDNTTLVCQGERAKCLPLHVAASRKTVPLSVVDGLVTAHPNALLVKDSRNGRLPLHLAIMKGASLAVVQYLTNAMPQALQTPDQDGNLPLHTACMYASDEIILTLLIEYAHACKITNDQDRSPLHILCARLWNRDLVMDIRVIKRCFFEYSQAVKQVDRHGRLPLHLACEQCHARWDVLQLLVDVYSPGLLIKDKSHQTPLQLMRKFGSDNTLVTAYLQERTAKEKRKHLLRFFKKPKPVPARTTTTMAHELYDQTYG